MGRYRQVLRSLGQKGGSLIQVLLGSTAIAGMALIGLELSKDQKKLAEKTSAVYEMKYLEDEITYLLENKKNCWANFGEFLLNNNINFQLEYLMTLSQDEITSRDKQIVKMKTLDAGGGLYGQRNIFIKEYTLDEVETSSSDEYSGSFKLIVNMVHRDSNAKETTYPKDISIYFSLNKQKGIGECTSLLEKNIVINNWMNNVNGGISYTAGKVGIGVSNPFVEVDVDGGVLLKNGKNLKCSDINKGTLRYFKENKKFEVCDGQEWVTLGKNSGRFSDYSSYRFDLKNSKEKSYEVREHRICTIAKLKKNQSKAMCKLKRLSSEKKSKYNIIMTAVRKNVELDCEVWCYD